MVSLRELTEQRGNQGREGEEERVLAVEPITMIVPPELQDVPETVASESSASSRTRDDGDDHPSASSSSSSTEETPSREEGAGDLVSSVSDRPVIGEWEGATISGRLSNLRKAPKDLPGGFKFKAALHHEVADCTPSISGYKRLEEMVRAYHIPKTILLRTGGQNERACTVSQTGWIPVYVDHFDAGLRFPLPGLVFDLLAEYELALTQITPNSIRFIMGFMLLCARLEMPAKAIVFSGKMEEAVRICSRHADREDKQRPRCPAVRMANSERPHQLPPAAAPGCRLEEPAASVCVGGGFDRFRGPGYLGAARRVRSSRGRGASSAQPRQTRFDERPPLAPQPRSSSHRGSSSSSRLRADNRAEAAAPSACRRAREETESEEDEVPLARRIRSGGTQPAQAARPTTVHSPNAPSATVRAAVEPATASTSMGLRIAYPEGFTYVRAELQPAMVQAMHSFVPPSDNKRAKAFVQQHGGQVAMIKLMDAFNYAVALYESEQAARTENTELGAKCKELAIEKASLVDDVNRLQGSEMANRAAAAESRADELAGRNNELREELDRARAEKESGIQAAKEETVRVEERAKKAEADRDRALHELASLRNQVAEAARNLSAAEEALNELKVTHGCSIAMARAQGAEWLVGSAAFQDAVAVASANVTTEIYNEIRGKVLHDRPDFPICELVFFDEEELDEQGKSLAPLADATVRLRWDLNEEGVPVWPPSVLEDGEDLAGLPSFDAWVEGAPVAEQEPSSTPPNSQPAVLPASSPVSAPATEPVARSPPARSPAAAADASMPVDLTDD
ncbi:hypothetical protein SLEP1_g2876 [Rubroshorea leprosula]|uniref:Transposase (putative) gypsy type domain-containing protein n=1 Tax=Rubroshorea leprosula TaxID=152421 RepID=A0AAV5HRV8_9ROSI|nr:hypothetical protein SLEP1_g2876 [Rubroshorea leprosula]